MNRNHMTRTTMGLSLLAILSCGDSATAPLTPSPSPPAPVATTVTVDPGSASFTALGETARFTAEVRDQNGQVMAGAAVAWVSSDASVATADASGQVTAAGNGTATITARAGSASGTTEVTVAQEVSAVAVSPAAATLVAFGDTVRLVAEATDANGHGMAGLDFSWSSSDAGVARVDDTGLVEAVAEGATTVTAMAGSVSETAAVTVKQQVSAVAVTPAADTLIVADTVRFSAAAADANGYAVAGAEFAWSSGDAAVVRVDSTGLVVAVRTGTATVTAVSEGVSGEAVVVVRPDFFALLQQFIDEHDIGAAALAVMEQGEIVYDGAVGFMDAQRQVPVAHDVIMRIASVTKPVTAAAVRRLVADGMLALDDRVFDLGQSGGGLLALDPFPTLGDSRLAEVTVQHLLEHRGGWDRDVAPDWAFREIQIAAEMLVPSPPGRLNTVRYALGQPLQFDPGSRRAYSNIGYMVLGLLIEEVSGQDYMTYVRENILAPLGIATGDVIRGRTLPADRSKREPWYDSRGLSLARNVFDPEGSRVPWPDGGWHHEAKIGHGGLVAPARAILAFLDAYVVFGDHIGRRRRGGEGPGWWAYHTGSLDGTNTLAFQSGNGVSYVILFNRRLPWGSSSSYVELFRQVLEDQLADPMAARYTVAEALAGKAESDGDDVLVSRGVTVGAGRGSR